MNSIQFDMQHLLSENTEQDIVFVVKNDQLDSLLVSYFSDSLDHTPEDQYMLDRYTYDRFVDLAMSSGYVEGEDFEEVKEMDEQMGSTTSGAGAYLPSLHASPKKYKGPELKEVADKEPKLATGKAKVYMKDKWGWKDAPSIPNRPSKGGFIYKKVFEDGDIEEREIQSAFDFKIGDEVIIPTKRTEFHGVVSGFTDDKVMVDITSGGGSTFKRPNMPFNPSIVKKKEEEKPEAEPTMEPKEKDNTIKEIANEDSVKIIDKDSKYFGRTGKVHDLHDDNTAMIIVNAPGNPTATIDVSKLKSINEGFKRDIKVRNESQQLKEATKMAKKKLKEVNSILEYAKQLKSGLNENECESCSRMMESMKKSLAEAYKKMKEL